MRCVCTALRLPAWGRYCMPSRSGQRTASPLSSSLPPQSTCCWPTAGLPSCYTCMHSVILSCILAFFCACAPACFHAFFLAFALAFLSTLIPSFHLLTSCLLFFVILLCDTCLPQKAEQCSESPSLVLRMALQTSLVNASALITASKPVDAS